MLRFASTAMFALLWSAAASAQTQGSWVEIADNVDIAALGANADTVGDWDVFSPDGVEIGEVEEVVGTTADAATALVVDFDDDGAANDRDEVVVPLEHFSVVEGRLILDLDAEAIAALPAYED